MNNFAINYDKRMLQLNYNGETFDFNLDLGDKRDFWHAFRTKDPYEMDVNLVIDEYDDKPYVNIYLCRLDMKDGYYYVDTDTCELVKDFTESGNKLNYLK